MKKAPKAYTEDELKKALQRIWPGEWAVEEVDEDDNTLYYQYTCPNPKSGLEIVHYTATEGSPPNSVTIFHGFIDEDYTNDVVADGRNMLFAEHLLFGNVFPDKPTKELVGAGYRQWIWMGDVVQLHDHSDDLTFTQHDAEGTGYVNYAKDAWLGPVIRRHAALPADGTP